METPSLICIGSAMAGLATQSTRRRHADRSVRATRAFVHRAWAFTGFWSDIARFVWYLSHFRTLGREANIGMECNWNHF